MTCAHCFLVSYDIAAPSRRRRVARLLDKTGQRNQLSVFLCRCSPARMTRLESEMKSAMDGQEDRLTILDLGPADSAAARIRTMNAMAGIASFETLIV